VTDEETPIFERGDVVYGDDPFKGGEDARPRLILSNHEGHPFHGDQYIALTLTSKSWMDGGLRLRRRVGFVVGLGQESDRSFGPSSRLTRRISTSGKAVSTEILLDQAVAALKKELQ